MQLLHQRLIIFLFKMVGTRGFFFQIWSNFSKKFFATLLCQEQRKKHRNSIISGF